MVSFPVYVRDDSGGLTLYTSFEQLQGYMEPVDVENNEFEAWDAAGNMLELRVGAPKAEWLKITPSGRTLPQVEFLAMKAKAIPYRAPEPLLRSLGRMLGIVRN